MDGNSNQDRKPLFYIIQPEMPPQEAPKMQKEYRSKVNQNKSEKFSEEEAELSSTVEGQDFHDKEQRQIEEERKLEQIKQEFGVNEVLQEIEDEIASVKKITGQKEEDSSSQTDGNNRYRNTAEGLGREELLSRLTKLARYPANVPKPICEAVVNGKIISFQVLSKRGNFIKVRAGDSVFDLDASEIQHFRLV